MIRLSLAALLLLGSPSWAGSSIAGNSVTFGTVKSKTVMKTGVLNTASTAGASVLSYTITSGTTFYMTYLDVSASLTVPSSTTISGKLGSFGLFSPTGVTIASMTFNSGVSNYPDRWSHDFSEPMPFFGVVYATATAAITTGITWIVNFGGYEK